MPIDGPTPIVIDRRTRNILVGLVLLAVVLLCWFAPTVPRLAIAGAALALILSFPVRLLSRVLPRGLAIALVMLLLVLAVTVALVILVPLAVSQLASLVADAPALAGRGQVMLEQALDALAERGLLEGTPEDALADLQREGVRRAQTIGQQALGQAVDALSGTFGLLLTLFGIVFVAIYLLVDSARFKRGFMRAVPLVYRDDAEELWDNVGESLSRYLAGLLISLSFQGIASTAALFVLGVPYSLLLGVWTAIGAIVPYVGSYIGGIPAVIAAFFVSPLTALLTAIAYFLINQVDGNLIAPRVQGQAIRVHPLLIFLAVIAGGEVAGLWGALVAVPGLAVLRAIIDFLDARLVLAADAAAPALAPARQTFLRPPAAPSQLQEAITPAVGADPPVTPET
jgi:predicted PurR-regulated permease PerM